MDRLSLDRLHLPKSTEINKFIAKTNFYKQAAITPRIHDLIEKQIDRITWVNKVAPTTMNVSSVDMLEFQVFNIKLKTPELDNIVPAFIQKSVPYPILFILNSARGVCIVAIIKGSNNRPVALTTDWQSNISFKPEGLSVDSIYKNYLLQLSPSFAVVDGDIEKYLEVVKLRKNISALSAKIKREVQINKRQHLARECHELEMKLKEIIGVKDR